MQTFETTSRSPAFSVPLTRRPGRPLRAQIEQALRAAIREGRLARGAAVPSTRALAGDLGVSRGVVVEAYEQLVAEGYLATRAASGTRVAAGLCRAAPADPDDPPPDVCRFDFRPGCPDSGEFPWSAWAGACRRARRGAGSPRPGAGDPRGAPELRAALSEFLARARGVVAPAGGVVVCTGLVQGLGIAGRVLRLHGVRRIAVEDPSPPRLRQVLAAAGLVPLPVPADDGGLDVDRLERSGAQAAVVAPAHQNPLGAVLAPSRRWRLLAWARRAGAYLVEDDAGAEFRHEGTADGALQGLDPERVLYLGAAGGWPDPGLGLAWLALPGVLRERAVAARRRLDDGVPALHQAACAELLAAGDFDRQLRRLRRLYRARRAALLRALSEQAPDWAVRGAAAGLHLVAEPPAGVDVARLVARAGRHSVRLDPLHAYAWKHPAHRGLLLAYARLPEDEIAEGVRRLAEAARRPTDERRTRWTR